jgi:hypothetical protein
MPNYSIILVVVVVVVVVVVTVTPWQGIHPDPTRCLEPN